MAAPVELYRDEFSTFTRDDQRRLVEQRWTNLAMSDQQFRDRISKLATFLEQAHVPNVLVDMTVMSHTPSGDFEEWRQSQIIPRFNAAGVERFALILPAGVPGTVESGAKPAIEGAVAKFPTAYFATRDRALKWFESPD
jgi:hypothetical protein